MTGVPLRTLLRKTECKRKPTFDENSVTTIMRSVTDLSTFSPLINGACKRLRDLCPTVPLPELCPCLALPTCNCRLLTTDSPNFKIYVPTFAQHLQLNRVCGSFIKGIGPLKSVKYVTSLDLKYVLCFHTKCFSEMHLLRIEFSKSLILFEYFSLAESKIVHFQSRGWWVVHTAQLSEIFLQLVTIAAAAVPNPETTFRKEEGRRRNFITKNSYDESSFSASSWS